MKNETVKSTVCIDASFAVRALVSGEHSQEVIPLIGGWKKHGVSLVAPAIFEFEVVSTLRRYVHLNRLSNDTGEAAYAAFWRLGIDIVNNTKVIPLAWKLAKQYHRPRIYDASYLAVAHLKKCEFWTMDRRLYNAVHTQLSWVRTIPE